VFFLISVFLEDEDELDGPPLPVLLESSKIDEVLVDDDDSDGPLSGSPPQPLTFTSHVSNDVLVIVHVVLVG
jgi:hypothetical protein